MKYNFENIKTFVTHAGIMHADEVFAAAFIQIAKKELKQAPVRIIRTFKVQEFMTPVNGYIVADIGKTEFDHHFTDDQKQYRDNGIPYAAFGLVVKEFYHTLLEKEEYELLDKRFIKYIDESDNYGTPNTLSSSISCFNNNWDEENPNSDPNFFEALEVAMLILNKQIKSVKSAYKAKQIAESAVPDNHVIWLDKYAPINDFIKYNNEVEFVGSPSLRGGYQVIASKDPYGDNKNTFFPYSGYNPGPGVCNEFGMTFCHSSGFMATFIDKEAAKKFMDTVMYPKH